MYLWLTWLYSSTVEDAVFIPSLFNWLMMCLVFPSLLLGLIRANANWFKECFKAGGEGPVRHPDSPVTYFPDWKRKLRGIHMAAHTADICCGVILNKSFRIPLPWHNLDVLPVIKDNLARLLWCTPHRFLFYLFFLFWHDGHWVLLDRSDVAFFQIFQRFVWWRDRDSWSWADIWFWRNYILHQTILSSAGTEPKKENIRADKMLGCLLCTQQKKKAQISSHANFATSDLENPWLLHLFVCVG